MNRRKKSSLADKISGVLSSAPAFNDPEDDVVDVTKAQIVSQSENDEDSNDEEILSKFRKQNVQLLADVDEKYAGRKGSRKNLKDSDEESSDEEANVSNAESENNTNEEVEEEEDDDVEEEESSYESGSQDDDGDELSLSEDEEDTPTLRHMNETNVSHHVKKGQCVKNQINLWESLLELRIQLQKCLITSNKMPQKDHFAEIKKQSTTEFTNKVTETKSILTGVLDKMLELQQICLKKFPETKKMLKEDTTVTEDIDDEEIPSDTDEEKEAEPEISDDEITNKPATNKKRKLADYEKQINETHKKYKTYSNGVIEKWYDKTRIAVMKNNTQTHTILNQIEYALNNREKLLERTRLKRSSYEILGKQDVAKNESDENINQYDQEIYDDDDFYHQLLRELIEVKSADVTDPVQLGRQWIRLQNMRSKMKRNIDTRATKGRKIRYAVHQKMVNFMAPIENEQWTDEAKNELYGSLFGKVM